MTSSATAASSSTPRLQQGSPDRDFGERSDDDIYLLYTGGTTGFPKGVMWRHEDIYRVLFGGTDFATGEFVKDEHDLANAASANPPMIRYPIPPMIHGATQSATWMSIFAGQTTVLAPEFNADEVWRAIHQHKVNLLFFTGDAMARPLLDALRPRTRRARTTTCRRCSCSRSTAALFSTSIKEQLLELLPNRVITDSIGSSETGFGGTSIVAKGEHHMGGPRVAIDHRTVVLDDDGNEVKPGSGVRGVIAKKRQHPRRLLQGPEEDRRDVQDRSTASGTRSPATSRRSRPTAASRCSAAGRCRSTRGGEKIYPEEVEAALKGHPDVFDALVVGVPDERYGQQVAAVVQPREGTRPTLADLDTFVRSRRSRDTKCRAVFGSSTRSSARQPASPTTDGPRTTTEERPADDVTPSTSG